jgi:hypothetical protein
MSFSAQTRCTAVQGDRRIASGELAQVALQAKGAVDGGGDVLLFDDATSHTIELDFRGTADDVRHRLAALAAPPADRLGVVAREVTLLPRHWEWLAAQPGGASVALRKLVEQARHIGDDKSRVRQSQEAAYRFMVAMAGNRPGFEEATRALFAGQGDRFDQETASWPPDVRDHARRLAAAALRKS